MTNQKFREALKAEPFVPFTLRMASGERLEVNHPDFAACPPEARVATVYDAKGQAYDRVDLLLVESLEFGGGKGGNGNGHGKRPKGRRR